MPKLPPMPVAVASAPQAVRITLDDASVITLVPLLKNVVRRVGEWDRLGNPIYDFEISYQISVQATPSLRGTPGMAIDVGDNADQIAAMILKGKKTDA